MIDDHMIGPMKVSSSGREDLDSGGPGATSTPDGVLKAVLQVLLCTVNRLTASSWISTELDLWFGLLHLISGLSRD